MKYFFLLLTFLATYLPAAGAAEAGDFKVLVFSKTAGFRHASISNGIAAIRALGTNEHFDVATSENSAIFSDASLGQFAAVIFLSTTGDVLDATQQAAFERYIRAGGGYVGIHAASDTEYTWPWYGGLVGAYFSSHPAIQKAVIVVEDTAHPSTRFLPEGWSRTDEWYNFQTNPRTNVHVLARLDESTYTGGTMGADHPIAWFHEYDGGRAWYTGGGHTAESFSDPLFLAHLMGGIRYAANAVPQPPPGALMLFDGYNGSHWTSTTNGTGLPWQTTNGTLTIVPGTGQVRTFQPFEDYLLHLEFMVSPSPPGTAEGALGNSGVFLQGQFEIQIVDSYGRPVTGANETGAIWGQRNPDVNAARPPGTWESLDIDFRAARWNGNVKASHARVSVWWNGVLVQNDVEIPNPTAGGAPPETPPPGAVVLQNLVGVVEFRNIWLLPRALTPRGSPVDLIRPGSTWRYLDDGSEPSAMWRAADFPDVTWALGRAQLGYGDGDEATVIRSDRVGGGRIITSYFRRPFTAANTTSLTNLELRLLRDDGAVVYLNGAEVFRSNMGNGAVNSLTPALTSIGNAQELQWVSTNLNPSLLVEGTNILAVEIHQSGTASTDVSFDLALSALQFDPPSLHVVRDHETITLAWPDLPAGFQLETASVLAGPWSSVTDPIATIPGVRRNLAITNAPGSNAFFRLRKN